MSNRNRAYGLTLVELVVVLAMISLLCMALAPSLQAARKCSRSEVCLANLQSLGVAIATYADLYEGRLPGPLHPAVYQHQTVEGYATHSASPASAEYFIQRQLGHRLREVVGDEVDRLIVCPTTENLVPDIHFSQFSSRTIFPFNYALNQWGGTSIRSTDPQYYFGYSVATGSSLAPQLLEAIPQPSKEWMTADAWYRPAPPLPFAGFSQEGPYQSGWSGEALPHFAPHFKRGSLRVYIDSDEREQAAAQVREERADGLTNTLFFDGHAIPVCSKTLTVNGFSILYGFPGTVNPYLDDPTAEMVWQQGTWE